MDIKRKYRIAQILNALKHQEKLRISEAAQLLAVSEMTIRRDINSDQDELRLLGGYIVAGAALNGKYQNHYFVNEEEQKNIAAKQVIGKIAAKFVENDDIIFFDSGTTVPFIVQAIDDSIHFTAVCYSVQTFLALQQKKHCRVILCGGEFKATSQIFVPLVLENPLEKIYTHKAFISAAGVSLEKGITTWILDEVKMKKEALENTEYAFLVADNEKFDAIRPGFFATLEDFDHLITDQTPPENIQQFIRHSNLLLTTEQTA